MQYSYETYKYDAAERQAKVLRKQVASNRNQENRGKQTRRRR